MSTNRNISAKEPLRYLKERIDRADLGEGVVRDRLRSHVVPFDELNVGGYSDIKAPEERATRIRKDFDTFMRARAEIMRSALKALAEGRNWPNEAT
jgi:hypothetical protein